MLYNLESVMRCNGFRLHDKIVEKQGKMLDGGTDDHKCLYKSKNVLSEFTSESSTESIY